MRDVRLYSPSRGNGWRTNSQSARLPILPPRGRNWRGTHRRGSPQAIVSSIAALFSRFRRGRTAGRSDVLAAVDMDFGAVDVRSGVRAEHVNDLCDFVRRAETVHRDILDDLFRSWRQHRRVD